MGWLPRPRLAPSVNLAMMLLTVAGCAVVAARFANHLIEGAQLADAEHGPRIAVVAAPAVASAAPPVKDGQAIVDPLTVKSARCASTLAVGEPRARVLAPEAR